MATIYALTEPDGEVRYIGKTVGTLRHRFNMHLSHARPGKKAYVARWIRGLLLKNMKPGIIIIEQCDGDGCERERFHIAKGRNDGLRLTNLTDGGEGSPGNVHPAEVREKIRQKLTGRTRSESHCMALREAFKHRKMTPQWIANAAAGKRGKKHSPEWIEKCRLARIGKKLNLSPETRLVMRLHRLGKKHTAESRKKMSVARQGLRHTPIQVAKRMASRAATLKPDIERRKYLMADFVRARIAAGVSISAIARHINVTVQSISSIERGQYAPTDGNLDRLRTALNAIIAAKEAMNYGV